MKSVWLAPAKINHFIHILGKRDDGYHNIQTIFQFVSLADKLELAIRNDGQIVGCYDLKGLEFRDDLIYKAALLLKKISGTELGISVGLDKRIPMGGGLGGGSSNAATMLVALNVLWELNYSTSKLMSLGAELGSDVPIFIFGQAAWAEGRGEILEPIATLSEKVVLLLFPNVQVSTKLVFADQSLPRNATPVKKTELKAASLRNDFQDVTNKIYPEVEKAFVWLSKRCEKVQMSGTGSTLFVMFDSQSEAEKIRKTVPDNWGAIVTQCLNNSPLLNSLKTYQNMASW